MSPTEPVGARAESPSSPQAGPKRGGAGRWIVAAILAVVLAAGAWAVLVGGLFGGTDGGTTPGAVIPGTTSSPPPSAADAPAAPSADQLVSGDWLLQSYRLDNSSGLAVRGTVVNRSTQPASADLTVWIYANGSSLGSVSTTVTDVPAGGSAEVVMTGDAVWAPGPKVVLLEAQ